MLLSCNPSSNIIIVSTWAFSFFFSSFFFHLETCQRIKLWESFHHYLLPWHWLMRSSSQLAFNSKGQKKKKFIKKAAHFLFPLPSPLHEDVSSPLFLLFFFLAITGMYQSLCATLLKLTTMLSSPSKYYYYLEFGLPRLNKKSY